LKCETLMPKIYIKGAWMYSKCKTILSYSL
jgi:hypothetical protein